MARSYLPITLALSMVFGLNQVHAASEAIIGGKNLGTDAAYAAILPPSGSLIPLDLGFDGSINQVAINNRSYAIIGGRYADSGPAYAAFVSPSGVITPLSISPSFNGLINVVAINNTSNAIIAGNADAGPAAYAALVSPSGALTPLTLGFDGTVQSVAINNASNAIIGAQHGGTAYAALVSPTGDISVVVDFSGAIESVAINNSSIAIVGGNSGDSAYAAYVSSTPTLIPLTLSIMDGVIQSVAINSASNAIIGGENLSTNAAYAALASYSSGDVTPLDLNLANGAITTVAINDSSTAIIGGENFATNAAYAAFVSPSGDVTPLNLNIANGSINSVAINQASAALIGGQNYGTNAAYAALVSPSGGITLLNLNIADGEINSVAEILDAVTPASVGSYSSVSNSVLAASYAFESHVITAHKNQAWMGERMNQQQRKSTASLESGDPSEQLADAKWKPNKKNEACRPSTEHSIWFVPFGNLVYQQSHGAIPNFSNEVIGGLLGYDYRHRDEIFGAAFAYSFNYTSYSESLGHTKINQEMGALFSSSQFGPYFFNATVWGGGYQLTNKRNSVASITSTGRTNGWILSPHVEFSWTYHETCDWFGVEPFGMVDWVNVWQDRFTETGASGFNLVMPGQYSSLLRSEAGLRFYEVLRYQWGRVVFEEKASYVNEAPFHVQSVNTYFVGAVPTFSVATGSSQVQNLAGVELHCSFLPWQEEKYPYGSFDFQGQFGSSQQMFFVGLEIGQKF